MEALSAVRLHKRYILGTKPEAPVVLVTVLLCNLTAAVMKTNFFISPKVHLKTKVLKHMYDKKPAQEYDFVIRHLSEVVMYPDKIYQNLDSKRGDYLFLKQIVGQVIICSIEKCASEDPNDDGSEVNVVVTALYLRKETYLKNYKLLWSWKGDIPSS